MSMIPPCVRQRIYGWLALVCLLAIAGCSTAPQATPPAQLIHFVYSSDAHYGITRNHFRGGRQVDARIVNAALVQSVNDLAFTRLPEDDGVASGQMVDTVDFLAETGDIANRQEIGLQSAAISWDQFENEYVKNIVWKDRHGNKTPLFLSPGNHDASNAIGFYRPMVPLTDATSIAQIYNRMMHPGTPRTAQNYQYESDKVFYAKDIGGIHFVFLNMWPDSEARSWLEQDLSQISANTPVLLFTHDPPAVDARHFINPNGRHDINDEDRFENLLSDQLADLDAKGNKSIEASTDIEQRALSGFLLRHKNVVAYFHGHSNWNEFYTWRGPDKALALNVFRVDSPMKGEVSSKDESKLSYQVVSIDPRSQKMTVRERLWNAPNQWGESITVSLQVRPN